MKRLICCFLLFGLLASLWTMREWIPIGGNTTAPSNSGYAFAGTFDGQGHSIRNLRITSGNCFVALFGRMTGKLCNLGIKSGQVKGNHCSVCNAVIKAQQTVAALGHSLQYINLDHMEHEVSCTRCAYRLREAHSFTEGSCVCEEPEFLTPVQDSSLRIYHSLNLASDISVNYILYASALEGYQMDTVYLECRYREYEGNTEAEEVNVRLHLRSNGWERLWI